MVLWLKVCVFGDRINELICICFPPGPDIIKEATANGQRKKESDS